MTDAPQVLLEHHLKKLKLPTFWSEHGKLARQCAAEGKDHVQYLLRLCELELIERERRMIERRVKAASAMGLGPMAAIHGELPATKSLPLGRFVYAKSPVHCPEAHLKDG